MPFDSAIGSSPSIASSEQDEDQQNADRYDHHQAAHGALLVFEFTAPIHVVARGQFHVTLHPLLHFLHDAAHIPAADKYADALHAQARFTARD